MLPTFIIIGAMKSGTTSLHNYLGEHPDVFMSQIKELDYFCGQRTWAKGLDWYTAQFPLDAPARGESSPGYTKYPGVSGAPERMAELVPGARLIYIMRDPVARIVSHYIDSVSFGREQRSLDEAMEDLTDNHYLACSRYHMQLSRYDGHYPRERILLLTTEQLRDRRAETIAEAFRFIGVDDSFTSEGHERVHYTAEEKSRKTRVGYALTAVHRTVGRSSVRRYLPSFLADAVRSFNERTSSPISAPTVSPELRGRLADALADDVAALRASTGRDFSEWSL